MQSLQCLSDAVSSGKSAVRGDALRFASAGAKFFSLLLLVVLVLENNVQLLGEE